MYRALCDACTKKERLATFVGCPLQLQLWSYERFVIGRPIVDQFPYPEEWYGEPEEDGPTMGSMWCRRRSHWAHEQAHNAYELFRSQFDYLHPDNMVWTPYSHLFIQACAPFGLSSLCSRDEEYWITKKSLIFDIYVEEYSPHHVMRQFGRFQAHEFA
ncbi:serine/threonine-protein phosphatase 7 long form homolog [Phragmites australis]|uniref:serine/threonine-protein phosphatase 7 long form homolog n=1 Tax=Phragmites australis TaxID=29695 RepID=UPI002D78BF86|nr:serine/threonine-protein phosphatase 7 long form homolog [Phragmites australis]